MPDGRDAGAEIKVILDITDELVLISNRGTITIELYDDEVVVTPSRLDDSEQTFPR